MTYTVQQFTDLTAAIATGQLEVQYADKRVKYQDLAEMRKLRDEMRAELESSGLLSSGNTTTNPRVALATFSRD